MKKSTTLILVFTLLFTNNFLLHGQDDSTSPWRNVENQENIATENNLFISNAHYFELDQVSLFSKLAQATKTVQTVIDVPMPDGTLQAFAVVEVSMMESALAANYPEIKTYKGYNVETPSSVLRLDISPRGFHAFILSNTEEVRIEPATVGNSSLHLSYYTKDEILATQAAHCGYTPDEPALNVSDDLNQNFAKNLLGMPVGSQLRTYRIAISTRGDLPQSKGWTTTAQVMTNIVSLLNEVNAIFERDLAMTFVLVANTDLMFYLDPATDPFTSSYLSENQVNTDLVIGDANYDVGHMIKPFSGGLAVLPSVCTSGNKAKGYSSYDFLKVVCHELGHQLGAGHSFNTETSGCGGGNYYAADAYEPGSGSTIMSYSGSCDPNDIPNPGSTLYFNAGAYDRITNYVIGGGNCYTSTATGNSAPVVTLPSSGFFIPISTPFTLSGSASDPDSDPMDYSWEQYDLGPSGAPDSPSGDAPIFRIFNPVSTSSRTFPQISDIINNTSTLGETLPTYTRNLTFRLMVRDGSGGVDYEEVSFDSDATAGPFLVQIPNTAVSWLSGSSQTVTWDVANTDNANVNCQTVNILLSSDGGLTYPTTLVSNSPNDGSETITLPASDCGSTFRVKVEANDNVFFDISNQDFSILPDISNQGIANINITTIDLTWSTVSATNFDIEYGAIGFTQGAGTTESNISGTSYNLTGLTAGMEYDYYLRINPSGCWIGPYSFMTLNCAEEVLPYTEDFENGGAFPSCWINSSTDDEDLTLFSGPTGTGSSGPNSAHSGSYYVYYEVSGLAANSKTVLVGPSFDLNGANEPELCFFYHMYGSAMGVLELQVESPVGASNWTTVWTLSGQQHTSSGQAYTQACINLSAYTGQTLRPRFVGTHLLAAQPWGDMAFDLITFTPCGAPSNISVSNTSETSADISWTNAGGSTWDLEYGAVGFSQGAGTTVSNINTSINYNLSSLTADTEYDVYVREHCSGNGQKSSWIGPINFTTLQCSLINLPHSQDFENAGALPTCWTQVSSDGAFDFIVHSGPTGSSFTGPSGAHSNNYYLYMEASNTGNGDKVQLLSPPFNFPSGTGYNLSFYYHMRGFNGEVGTLEAEIEAPAGSGNWTSVWSLSGVQQSNESDPYLQALTDISAHSGSTARLRFTTTDGTGGQGDISFDLVEITSGVVPVELTKFAGFLSNDLSVELIWETAAEINNQGFEIEHSLDGLEWKQIVFVEGQGNSTEINEYKYLHNRPAVGINYYRLKQIDFDQHFEYSNIISIEVPLARTEDDIQIFPNPAQNKFNITSEQIINEVEIIDVMGRIYYHAKPDDKSISLRIDEDGLYFVKVRLNEQTVMRKLIVKH